MCPLAIKPGIQKSRLSKASYWLLAQCSVFCVQKAGTPHQPEVGLSWLLTVASCYIKVITFGRSTLLCCSMSWRLLPRLWRPQLARPLLQLAPKPTAGLLPRTRTPLRSIPSLGRFSRTLLLGGAVAASLASLSSVRCDAPATSPKDDTGLALALADGRKVTSKAIQPKDDKSRGGGIGRIAVAMVCWSFFASLWFVSITMPAALVWSLATAKWKVMSALLAAYCFPHVITVPALPRSATHAFWGGLQGWFPEGMEVLYVGAPEPEPEPPSKGERRKRLFCIHPHGIYTLGALALPDHVPEVRLCIAPYLYHFAPVFRVVAELLGVKLGSTGPRDLKRLMEKENSPMAIVPGGFEEATVTCRFTERVFLKTRAGFIKYALRHGYDLVPCFTVGDSDMFSNPQGAWRFRWWLNGLSIPAVVPWGFPVLPLLPKRVFVKLAIGPPLHMPHIENPTREEVEKHRKRYVAALQATYAEAIRGTPSDGRPLEIW
eukprot:s485_g16.t1